MSASMMQSASSFIPPDVRARLKYLRLTARAPVAGAGIGQHVSRNRGAGLEFAQYRAYEPGDEPRRIDWKLFARSDRYFVRESERDSPLNVWLVVDATASMAQADATRPDWSKLDATRALAACVIELALRQGDRFGVVAISGDGVNLVPAATGSRQRDRCLLELQRVRAVGTWPDETSLRPVWERIGPASLLVFLSDCFDEKTVALAERLAAARRDVLTIQMLSVEERDFPFHGGHRFRDPESGAELRVDAPSARNDYLERFAAARAQLTSRCAAAGIRHAEYFLDQALDAPLQRFFAARSAESRSA